MMMESDYIHDMQLTPPSISQDDARKGLLSLLERGLIPVSYLDKSSAYTCIINYTT